MNAKLMTKSVKNIQLIKFVCMNRIEITTMKIIKNLNILYIIPYMRINQNISLEYSFLIAS